MSWHRPHAQARTVDGALLCTRQQIAALTKLHPDQIRRACPPVACDVRTRAVLIDATPFLPVVEEAA